MLATDCPTVRCPALAGREVVYCTIDEVNRADFAARAESRGARPRIHEPRDGDPCGAAVVIDADFYWPGRAARKAGIEALLMRLVLPGVLAIHGWQLEDAQIDRLRASGCIVRDKLDDALLDAVAAKLAGVAAAASSAA